MRLVGIMAMVGLGVLMAQACSAAGDLPAEVEPTGGAGGQTSSSIQGGAGGTTSVTFTAGGSGGGCHNACSEDNKQILDCYGEVLQDCAAPSVCDPSDWSCRPPCDVAVNNKHAIGCEYYATFMNSVSSKSCFAAFIANTWDTPAHLSVAYQGNLLPVASFARIPSGSGNSLTYAPYDPAKGIAPGEVVILFLSGDGPGDPDAVGKIRCPIDSAIKGGVHLNSGTGVGDSFLITSDVPVVGYQINPYGGAEGAADGATLLLPTSVWDTNYVLANAYRGGMPSLNIVAGQDGTTLTMVPVADIKGFGGMVPAGKANQQYNFKLDRGQHLQITQADELTGSVLSADKPVGVMAGHWCNYAPEGQSFVCCCDHSEQAIPPVKALGHEYVAVMHRQRASEPALWRIIGAVNDTKLTWSSDVGGPSTLQLGQAEELLTDKPFVVSSQDEDHPFILLGYMVGGHYPSVSGQGDPETVISVPPKQYLKRYVFFTDPTHPETNLVLVRSQAKGMFHDVTLDCAGVISGWQPIGDYQYARVDVSTLDPNKPDEWKAGNCSNGAHEIHSDAPFGLWIWGWGTFDSVPSTGNSSYGYPGGMNVQPINDVVIVPKPK